MTDEVYKEIFSRNRGLFAEEEQEILRTSTIGIAGTGGVGGLLAERLIRLGVGGIKITDPDSFEKSNFNRQFGSTIPNIGKNKSEVIFELIRNINPLARIQCSNKGLKSEQDAADFASGCDVVIDEMDLVAFKESIRLQRAARKNGSYYLFGSAIGFGALVAIFDPRGQTLEEYNKLAPDIDVDEISKPIITFEKALPYMPSYAPSVIDRLGKEMSSGKFALPTTSIGAGIAAVLAANEAINILLKKREIVTAPKYTYIDLIDRKFFIGEMK